MTESASAALRTIVEDPNLNAIEKFHAYFEWSSAWKTENMTAVITAMRLWRDENALVRQKLSQESMHTTAPLLEAIIRQGHDEGVFDTDHPREAAVIITGMGLHLTDQFLDAIQADGSVGADTSGGPISAACWPPITRLSSEYSARRQVRQAH